MGGKIAVTLAGPAADDMRKTKSLGQVATRCAPPTTNTAGNKEWVCRSVRRMMAPVSRFKLVLSYGALASLREADPGGPATFMATVEYPIGTKSRVLFGGAVKGVCPGLGHLESDWINLAIPAGAEWIVNIQGNAPVGGAVYNAYSAANQLDSRDKFLAAASFSGADYTADTTYAGGASFSAYWPSAVVAETDASSALLVGDSRVYGANDTIDATLDLGDVARAVGQSMGYINIARSGDWATYFNGDHDWRMALAKYCRQAIFEYGINDVLNQGTSSFIGARLQRYTDNFLRMIPPEMPAFVCTMGPNTTSTDLWATTVNQTIPSAQKEAARTTENDRRRGVPSGWAGCIDLADQMETSRNSGIWKPNYTDDGTHCVRLGTLAIRDANIIQPVLNTATIPPRRSATPPSNQRRVEVKTATLTLTEPDTGRTFSNEGAAAIVPFALPEAIPGLVFTFIVQDADGIRVTAFSGDTIRIGASVSAAAGKIESTAIGSVVTLVAINQVEWIATHQVGTWAVT